LSCILDTGYCAVVAERGIVFVVFGERFDRIASRTVSYTREHTDLPITVLTNIDTNNRSRDWQWAKGIEFVYISEPDGRNRFIKTALPSYSPYESTLYLDCDATVQRSGIERAFDLLDSADLLLRVYGDWDENTRVPGYYLRAWQALGVGVPIRIYYGAFVGFRKTDAARDFFRLWQANWIASAIPREMPALAATAATARERGAVIAEVRTAANLFSWKPDRLAVVQHEYGDSRRFWEIFWLLRGVKWST